ncbi:alpha/beta fold hydrolase [Vibrio nitrifigilis]|uniref:Alpha/beta hydrolase n=1 Tax=Vibrio nitrifigilis TaxID=2789781 RepID=A0ABS0GKJ0_9VIBR|nr:alpha/beta hydrolase [Vibrio nitrifigilis]MBF9002958.1 alpha/beta hydrolase [Vibrio nitrifigilis]
MKIRKNKKTIIFLHGGPGFDDYLESYFSNLNDTFNCVFYSQKKGPNIVIDELVEEIDVLVNKCEHKPIILGHSWGGVLALKYNSLFKNKICGLILMNTGLNTEQWLQYRETLKSLKLEDAEPEDIFMTEKEKLIGLTFFENVSRTLSVDTFSSIFERFLSNFDLINELSAISFPILNIFGGKDYRFPVEIARSFKKFNPNIIELELRDSGHFPFILEDKLDRICLTINNIFNKNDLI